MRTPFGFQIPFVAANLHVFENPWRRDIQEYLDRRVTGGIATSGLIVVFFVRRLNEGG